MKNNNNDETLLLKLCNFFIWIKKNEMEMNFLEIYKKKIFIDKTDEKCIKK